MIGSKWIHEHKGMSQCILQGDTSKNYAGGLGKSYHDAGDNVIQFPYGFYNNNVSMERHRIWKVHGR